MPRKNTLTRADFIEIGKSRFRREHGTLFSLSYGTLPDQRGETPKIACVVSKKVAPKAVDRNRIRRRCYAAVREYIADVMRPCVFVFYAKSTAKDASYGEIKKNISFLMEEAESR